MKHGANIYKYAKKLGCNAEDIVDFSSNINLYNPKNNFSITSALTNKYADSSYKKLKNIISKNYQIKKSNIALFNGASSAIFELFKHLDAKRVYLYAPLYGEYEDALDAKTKLIKINRFKNLHQKVKKGSTVVFVNPSTPDAKNYDLSDLMAYWQKRNCTIILDESFLEFEGLASYRHNIQTYDKLYIIQSFTKFYSCAGVRIGAIFSSKDNVKKFKIARWNISSFDVAFLSQRLQDKKFILKSKELHLKQKKELKNILKTSNLFSKIYKSKSNFFLCKSKHAKELFKHLLKHKILVRDASSFDFLDTKHLRFAVKDKKSHKKLQKALKDFKHE